MSFDPGTILAVAAALFFYLRLIILQRQKVKIYQKQLSQRSGMKSGKAVKMENMVRPTLTIANKYLVVGGTLLVIIGAAMAGLPGLNAALSAFWWIPITLGIVLMGLGIR